MDLLFSLVAKAFNDEDQRLIAECIVCAKTKYVSIGERTNLFDKEHVIEQACDLLLTDHPERKLIREVVNKAIRVYWHESTVWCEKILN